MPDIRCRDYYVAKLKIRAEYDSFFCLFVHFGSLFWGFCDYQVVIENIGRSIYPSLLLSLLNLIWAVLLVLVICVKKDRIAK